MTSAPRRQRNRLDGRRANCPFILRWLLLLLLILPPPFPLRLRFSFSVIGHTMVWDFGSTVHAVESAVQFTASHRSAFSFVPCVYASCAYFSTFSQGVPQLSGQASFQLEHPLHLSSSASGPPPSAAAGAVPARRRRHRQGCLKVRLFFWSRPGWTST